MLRTLNNFAQGQAVPSVYLLHLKEGHVDKEFEAAPRVRNVAAPIT